MASRVNHLAVFVSAIVFFVLAWLWFGPIFGKSYANMLPAAAAAMSKNSMTTPLIVTFVMGWLLSYVIGIALSMRPDPNPMQRGIGFGIFMSLGVYGTMTLMGAVWAGASYPLGVWAIDTGFVLVAMAIIGAIIGAWSARVPVTA